MKNHWQKVLVLGLLLTLGTWVTIMAAEKGPGEFQTDYKTSGNFFTLMSGMKMGKSPHGEVQIWYSKDLKDLLGKPSFKAPVGAVAIKPFKKGEMAGIAIMIKKDPGYDPRNNDWAYEMRTPDGKVQEQKGMPMSGKIDMCISCHIIAPVSDYLLGTTLR
jgi:hypothetical protein